MEHTDQCRQFISNNYRVLQDSRRIKQSTSKRGYCWDNTVIESFFNTLKTEVTYQLPKQNKSDPMKWAGLLVNLWGIIIIIDLIVRMTNYHQISWRKSA